VVAIQFYSIGFLTYSIAVTIQEPTQVTLCCNLLSPVGQLSSNSRSARMSFSQAQRVFIVEHLPGISFLLNFARMSLGIKFPNLLCQTNQQYWAVHFKRHCRNSSPSCIKHEDWSECMQRWTLWTFPTRNIILFFIFYLLYFFWQMCREWVAWLFDQSVLFTRYY
jgi:hypothetical protein